MKPAVNRPNAGPDRRLEPAMPGVGPNRGLDKRVAAAVIQPLKTGQRKICEDGRLFVST